MGQAGGGGEQIGEEENKDFLFGQLHCFHCCFKFKQLTFFMKEVLIEHISLSEHS